MDSRILHWEGILRVVDDSNRILLSRCQVFAAVANLRQHFFLLPMLSKVNTVTQRGSIDIPPESWRDLPSVPADIKRSKEACCSLIASSSVGFQHPLLWTWDAATLEKASAFWVLPSLTSSGFQVPHQEVCFTLIEYNFKSHDFCFHIAAIQPSQCQVASSVVLLGPSGEARTVLAVS